MWRVAREAGEAASHDPRRGLTRDELLQQLSDEEKKDLEDVRGKLAEVLDEEDAEALSQMAKAKVTAKRSLWFLGLALHKARSPEFHAAEEARCARVRASVRASATVATAAPKAMGVLREILGWIVDDDMVKLQKETSKAEPREKWVGRYEGKVNEHLGNFQSALETIVGLSGAAGAALLDQLEAAKALKPYGKEFTAALTEVVASAERALQGGARGAGGDSPPSSPADADAMIDEMITYFALACDPWDETPTPAAAAAGDASVAEAKMGAAGEAGGEAGGGSESKESSWTPASLGKEDTFGAIWGSPGDNLQLLNRLDRPSLDVLGTAMNRQKKIKEWLEVAEKKLEKRSDKISDEIAKIEASETVVVQTLPGFDNLEALLRQVGEEMNEKALQAISKEMVERFEEQQWELGEEVSKAVKQQFTLQRQAGNVMAAAAAASSGGGGGGGGRG
eukprot:g500.t1